MFDNDDNSKSEDLYDDAELSAELELEIPPSSEENEQELQSLSELEYKPDPPLLSVETETLSSLLEQQSELSEENETLEEIISEGPEPNEELSEENIEMTSAQSEVVAPTFYEGFLIKLAREVFGREI